MAYQIPRSLRFRSSASAYLSRTPAGAGTSTTKATLSFWMKNPVTTSSQTAVLSTTSNNFICGMNTSSYSGQFFVRTDGTNDVRFPILRDPSSFIHICAYIDTTLVTAADRIKVDYNGVRQTSLAGTQPSQNSAINLNSAVAHAIAKDTGNSTYADNQLAEFYVIDGQALSASYFAQTDATTGAWTPIAYSGTYGTNGFYLPFSDNSGITPATLGKDTSGTNVLSTTGTTASSTALTAIAGTVSPQVGQVVTGSGIPANTYLTVVGGISGAWTATMSAAATTTVVGGALVFTGNNWTPSGISVTADVTNDSLVDTPTNYGTDTGLGGEVRGNYCTLNPLVKGTSATLSAGNLGIAETSSWYGTAGTFGMSSGKWYFEYTVPTAAQANIIGVTDSTLNPATNGVPGFDTTAPYMYRSDDGKKAHNGAYAAYGATWQSNGDIIGVALDMDAGTLTFYKNGASQGQAFSGITGTQFPCAGMYNGSACYLNFGQRAFAYTAPSGFKALCTQNLPDPAILKPASQFNAAIYTGNGTAIGSGGKAISTDGSTANNALLFKPDLVWIKGRSGATSHGIYDVVRTATKDWGSDLTTDETTQSEGVTSFDTTGFTTGSLAKLNTNAATYVSWLWKGAGSSSAGSGSGLTSISSSINATNGLSITAYTGHATGGDYFNHGLGVAPSIVIIKPRTTASTDYGATVWHSSLANTEYLTLSATTAKTTGATTFWNSTTPDSTKVTLGTAAQVNANADTFIAYVFAEVAGFSKFGSYTGNGSTDGPFVWCGFKPRWIMVKRTDSSNNWCLYDTARNTYNIGSAVLFADTSAAESSEALFDILSNGFKVRITNLDVNASGGTYIFAAFADVPFKYASGSPYVSAFTFFPQVNPRKRAYLRR